VQFIVPQGIGSATITDQVPTTAIIQALQRMQGM
jgi:hypothetical protein